MKTILSILQVIAIVIAGCNSVEVKNDPNLSLVLEKYILMQTDSLKGVLTVTNHTENIKVYKFSSGCQYGLEIKKGSKVEMYFPSICPDVLTSFSLNPNESKEFKFALPLTEYFSGTLTKGKYILYAYLLENNSSTISREFEIN